MKYNMEIYEKAVRKIKEKNDLKEYFAKCLEGEVCPECGNDLEVEEQALGKGYYLNEYKCSSCKFEHHE